MVATLWMDVSERNELEGSKTKGDRGRQSERADIYVQEWIENGRVLTWAGLRVNWTIWETKIKIKSVLLQPNDTTTTTTKEEPNIFTKESD